MRYLFSGVFIFIFSFQLVFAQADTEAFTIRVLVGSDVTPPTTPVLLSATAVAPIQIDIVWSLSTDNFSMGGYSLFRDGVPIATTTLTSYSDTGLSATTTYTYVVKAFDLALNYSATSNSLTATTTDYPPVPPPKVYPPSTAARVALDSFVIDTGLSTASFELKTAHPARMELRWGKTDSYELGYIVSNVFTSEHSLLLTDLEPGTIYEYELIGYTPFGLPTKLRSGEFTTNDLAPVPVPRNVARFIATASQFNVDLSWRLPKMEDIAHVRIVRSYLGFPEHPQDGAIIYQGLGSAVTDPGVLGQYSPVFYTAFVYDKFGNVSSGAITIVYVDQYRQGDLSVPIDNPGQRELGQLLPGEGATTSINYDRLTSDMKMPTSDEIYLKQGERIFSMFDSELLLSYELPFTISIPEETIAGNLKSIIVTLYDPTDSRNQYAFLLRINKNQTAYEATVAPLQVAGKSKIVIEIYDYEALVVATYQNTINFIEGFEVKEGIVFPDALFKQFNFILLGLGILFVLIALIIFIIYYRNRGEDND